MMIKSLCLISLLMHLTGSGMDQAVVVLQAWVPVYDGR